MSEWFAGSIKIVCSLQRVKTSFEELGQHYLGVVRLMPGLTSVELVDQGLDFVTIKTNEGVMKRNQISMVVKEDSLVLEFDEEYQAGSLGTVKTHYYNEFKKSGLGVELQIVLNIIEAPGLMGFFYRTFGKSSTGNAVLKSNKTYFEALTQQPE